MKFYNLHRTEERLAETTAQLQVVRELNRPQALTTRPVLEPPRAGNLHTISVFSGNLTPRENAVISTSRLPPSNKSIETYLTKIHQEWQENITRELAKDAANY